MRPLDVLLGLLVMLIWGGNFGVAKAGIAELPPILLVACRFALIAAILVPFVRLPRETLGRIALISVSLGSAHFSLMFTGLAGVDAAVAAIATQAQVPFSAMLGVLFLGDRIRWRRGLGMAFAFAGVVLLAGEPRTASNLGSLAMIVAASLLWAVANVQIKQLGRIDGFTLNAYVALFAAPQLLLVSLVVEEGQWAAVASAGLAGWGAVVYMAVAVTIVSYGLWYGLIQRYELSLVMPFTLLGPVFGVLVAVVMLGEPLTVERMIGGAVTILGIAIIVLRRPETQAPPATRS